ncbi:hypothetical protein GCM10027447_33640 [Glycomyces halotolerans]
MPTDDSRRPEEPTLPYGERYAWGYLTTAIAVPTVYFAIMLGRLSDTPADEIAFQLPLLIAIGASIVLNMFLAPAPRRGRDRTDERDTDIAHRAQRIGYYTLSVAMVAPFALVMLEAPYFWIAGAVYLAYVVSAVVESIVKIAAYRRGF